MRKLFTLTTIALLFLNVFSLFTPVEVSAACFTSDWEITQLSVSPTSVEDDGTLTFTIDRLDFTPPGTVYIIINPEFGSPFSSSAVIEVFFNEGQTSTDVTYQLNGGLPAEEHRAAVFLNRTDGQCSELINFSVIEDGDPPDDPPPDDECKSLNEQCMTTDVLCDPDGTFCNFTTSGTIGTVQVKPARGCTQFVAKPQEPSNYIDFEARGCSDEESLFVRIFDSDGNVRTILVMNEDRAVWKTINTFPVFDPGTYTAHLSTRDPLTDKYTDFQTINFEVPVYEVPTEEESESKLFMELCDARSGDESGIPTALGCIDIESNVFTFALLITIGISISGGVAFILIAIASFMIMTSQGDPQRLQHGRELFLSATIGLILIVLSTLIIRILGGTLLGLF